MLMDIYLDSWHLKSIIFERLLKTFTFITNTYLESFISILKIIILSVLTSTKDNSFIYKSNIVKLIFICLKFKNNK